MDIVIPFFLVLVLVIFANLVAINPNRKLHRSFDILLLLLNIPLFIGGVLLIFLPPRLIDYFAAAGMPALNPNAAGWVLLGTGLWGAIFALYPSRRFFTRPFPVNPDSPVQTLALVLSGYLVGNTILALTQDILQELAATSFSVTIVDVVIQQIGFIIIAFLGVGFVIRRDSRQAIKRLGLLHLTKRYLLIVLVSIIILVIFQSIIGAFWLLLDPNQAEFFGSLNESLLAGFDTPGEWLILAIASGIGEELLFRGALQPAFGVWPTALLFAIIHIQYGFSPITLTVFILGLYLGYLRKYTNTSVVILVHFGYNLTLGLLSLLAVYLEQFVS